MRRILLLLMAVTISKFAICEEGMWLPSLIGETKLSQMQELGLKLSAEDLYSITQPSLKDAIVNIGGCTGELISAEGLLITNHHCGYGQIQFHSSQERDYLTNGFTAMSRAEELPCMNYSAKFLIRAEDVTAEVTAALSKDMSAEQQRAEIEKAKNIAINKAIKGTHYEATVEPLYNANQYFLFVYEKFTDLRLVVAPPSSVGKFGGDTDNWMWPRHTGDFTMFRIYADKDGKPADYSSENVPLKPKKFFKIDTRGTKEGDFTMVYGYPGKTYEYLFSDAVSYIGEKSNPAKIDLRTIRLDVMNEHQARSVKVRIQYASKNASVSNAWKKWQGEMKGIIRLGIIDQKREYEQRFSKWAEGGEFADIIPTFKELYSQLEPYAIAYDYYNEALRAMELPAFAGKLSMAAAQSEDALKKELDDAQYFFKNYSKEIDYKISTTLFPCYFKAVGCDFYPEIVGTDDEYINRVFSDSKLQGREFVESLKSMNFEQQKEAIESDIATEAYKLFQKTYRGEIEPQYSQLNNQINKLYERYMQGMMLFEPDRLFYPDANSTLRIAYGQIKGFTPRDGVYYNPHTTLDGVMAKDNPEIYDYDIPERLRELYAAKDYGRWEVNGTVPVAFLASNHTTGGNSGSPVVSAEGHLLGTNFDRCWESTMSDVVYDPDMCRNIAVDVRYVMFLTDKLCGAGYLLDEMVFVE